MIVIIYRDKLFRLQGLDKLTSYYIDPNSGERRLRGLCPDICPEKERYFNKFLFHFFTQSWLNFSLFHLGTLAQPKINFEFTKKTAGVESITGPC